MAVSFTDSINDDFVWSLERPMYLRYSKDVDNSAVVVSIAITQGSYSKTLTLKYSGLIKEIEMNISSLIKAYFQHIDYTGDFNTVQSKLNSLIYPNGITQKVIITITDDDNSINTTQFFVKNANNVFIVNADFGDNNYNLDYFSDSDTFTIYEDYKLFNHPINMGSRFSALYRTQVKVQRLELDDTLIDEIYYTYPYASDERVVAIPIGNKNFTPNQTGGIKLLIQVYYNDGFSWAVQETVAYTFLYAEYCDTTRKKDVWFESRYGGIESIVFANHNDGVNRVSNDFTLQSGDKTRLNIKNRRTGSLISDYVKEGENEIYTAFALSEKIQFVDDSGDTLTILLTSKSHRIKQIDNVEMKQYTFTYEEVERLKY